MMKGTPNRKRNGNMPLVSLTNDHTLKSRMMGNYHVRFGSGGGESDLLADPQSTDEQRVILAQTFGCCRFVYNWGLHTRSFAYKEQGQKLSYNALAVLLPDLKREYPWL